MSDFCWTCKSFERTADCATCKMILALGKKPARQPRQPHVEPSVPAFFARLQALADRAVNGIDVVDDSDEEKENKT